MKKIKCLPVSVHSSLRASVFLFDITRVVEELVLNSLDAGATEVMMPVAYIYEYSSISCILWSTKNNIIEFIPSVIILYLNDCEVCED